MFRRLLRRDEKIEQGLTRTRSSFLGRVAVLFGQTGITDETWDELEEALLSADVGSESTIELLDKLRAGFRRGEFTSGQDLSQGLQEELLLLLRPGRKASELLDEGLTVVLVIGVNGVGKTTTVAKLGNYWRNEGRGVMLAAGDTFRAAGAEQLELWSDRLRLPCIAAQSGADPGSVVFDAIGAARARGLDLVLVDTAGRLHTKSNLMEELRKIRRVADRGEATVKSLLVLDATTGQNAVLQARSFAGAAGLDGIVVTKLDGTAKGGVVFSVVRELGAPVLFAGTGEKVEDISEFDGETFVAALFEGANEG